MNVCDCSCCYLLTSPLTMYKRVNKFVDKWFEAKDYFSLKTGLGSYLPDLHKVMGMNSKRFPRSPFWRVGDKKVDVPDRETGNGLDRRGHTACYWLHMTAWQTALAENDSKFDTGFVLFCEDDAWLDKDAFVRMDKAIKELPENWDIIYFGGQHCVNGRPRPEEYSENLYKIQNVNRTHCYAIKLSSLPKIILWFNENWDWGHNFHDPKTGHSEAEVDFALGHLTETGFLNGFAIRPTWVCSQGAFFSYTQGKDEIERRWEL